MAYCNRATLTDYLTNFTGQDPVKAVTCAYSQDAGAGMGLTVFSLLFFGAVGLGLTIRVQHPGPILVAGMLSAGVIALSVAGQGASIMAIIFLFGIAALGLYLYAKAQSSL